MEMNAYLANLSTEQVNPDSQQLDQLDGAAIAALMNQQDYGVVDAVAKAVPVIGQVIDTTAVRMKQGGRLFYVGAGTSGRLGVLDASECPPTFGVPETLVQGVIAGDDRALRHAIEGAEDNEAMGGADLQARNVCDKDVVVAISASGFAAYCAGALLYAKEQGALAVSLTCNEDSALSKYADYAIEVPTGPEVLMGSTRLKAGTATKMVLNMLSTGAMVRTGRVYRNLMVDLSVSNTKLRDRAARIISHATGLDGAHAATLLERSGGSVKTAIVMHMAQADAAQAQEALTRAEGWVTPAIGLLKKY